jgi:hypothetical protein
MNVLYFILPPYHTLSRAPTPLPLNLTLPNAQSSLARVFFSIIYGLFPGKPATCAKR